MNWKKFSSNVGQSNIALPLNFSRIKVVALHSQSSFVFSQSIVFDREEYTFGKIPICSGDRGWLYIAAIFKLYATGNSIDVDIIVGDVNVTSLAYVDIWYTE